MSPPYIIKYKGEVDLGIYVYNKVIKDNKWYIKGEWIIFGNQLSYVNGVEVIIVIHEKYLKNWDLCMNPHKRCIRDARWEALA